MDLHAPVFSTENETLDCPDGTAVEAIVSSWGMPPMTDEWLRQFPRLQILFYGAGTIRTVATEASWNRGIRVVSAAAANAVPTAEFAFASILMALKQTWFHALRGRCEGRFERQVERIAGAVGSTVGLIGLGQIGRLVAQKLSSLQVNILAHDPMLDDATALELGVRSISLEELFRESHVVSCHAPLLPQTRRMIRGTHFSSMRRHASFINTARGALIDENEMISELTRRSDLFAHLDVTYPEPPPKDSPLWELPNVMLTPHLAGSQGPECSRMGNLIADEVERFANGKPLQHEVTRERAMTSA